MKDQNQDLEKYIKGRAKAEQRKKLQQARRKEKPRQKSKQPRQKDWRDLNEESWDELDLLEEERIMPRGEQQRRKNMEQKVFEQQDKAAQDQDVEGPVLAEGQRSGLVTEISSGRCRVLIDDDTLLCDLRGSLLVVEEGYSNPLAVGDEVIVTVQDESSGVVEAVLPRRSALVRQDVGERPLKHIIAANLDQVLIVAAWLQPHFWPELVDRYLIAAERNQLTPVLCVNKIDLLEDQIELETVLWPYRQLDIPILLTSAEDSTGIDDLRQALAGKITALAGLSGVGKSSLLNAAYPHLELRVGAVSDDNLQGRHTTTQANLIHLNEDSLVIDTPGIRNFGLAGLRRNELIEHYPELLTLAGACKFSDCAHKDEPGCAVRVAVENGEVAEGRFKSYQKIYMQLPA
ncbi:MAG: ribosome small subunit-dependent GTPase A [Chloroflexi bacterium]|nr:MAG: ribosome small subunit-dependent GTPase A [Chloroflexota bacterium]MBL1194613.1 ribosome small subunit-dependent GTPase A [Chloroflexota bacterium]NOH11903.1 ribosome small subunit-dependent GTPase A [Chloroflexota bacterium]